MGGYRPQRAPTFVHPPETRPAMNQRPAPPGFAALLHSVVLPQGRRLQMAELRELAGDLGLQSVQTVGASGNLLFSAPRARVGTLERRLEQGFAQRFGKPVPIIVRRAAELAALPARNPFGSRFAATQISVRLMREPCRSDLPALLQRHVTDEILTLVDGDLWLGFAGDPARSRIPAALSRRELAAIGTFRSLAMLERIRAALRGE